MEATLCRPPGPATEAQRLRKLPRRVVFGVEVPSAETRVSRLLGLALLSRAEAGLGLLIPGCRAIHTFGMCFPLDVLFLDRRGMPLRVVRELGPGRFAVDRRADAVLELPSRSAPPRFYDQEEESDVA